MSSSVVVQNALWLYAVQLSGYVLPLLSLPYLSRVLSVEHFGLIAFGQSVMWNFVILVEYGFNLTATRDVAIHRDDYERVSRTFNSVMAAKTLLTIMGFIGMLALVFSVPRMRENWPLFVIMYMSVLGYLLFPLWLFQGLEKMKWVAIRDFAAKLVSVAALFIFVHRDSDYLIAAATQSGGLLLAGIAGFATVPFVAPVRLCWPGWDGIRDAFRTGWPPFLSAAGSTIMNSVNLSILGFRGQNAELGYLNAAYRITSFPRALIGPVSTSVFSHVSRKAAGSEMHAINFVRKYGLLIAAPFIAMSVSILLASSWIVSFVLGPKYRASLVPLQILSVGPAIAALSTVYATYYMLACGYDKAWIRIMISSILVNFAVLIPLVMTTRGSVALAVAMIATEAFACIACWGFYRRRVASMTSGNAEP